jgi:cell division protein FtsN
LSVEASASSRNITKTLLQTRECELRQSTQTNNNNNKQTNKQTNKQQQQQQQQQTNKQQQQQQQQTNLCIATGHAPTTPSPPPSTSP